MSIRGMESGGGSPIRPVLRRGLRRLVLNLAVAAGALLVGALILEGIIRASGIAYDPQFDRRGGRIMVRSADPDIRAELPAGYDGLMLGAHVVTNSFGLRGPEVPLEKPAGTFRLAVLGDSWAFGWGVDQGEEMPAALQRILREEAGPDQPRYEVLNFSVPAYNTLQELAVLRTKALRFQPDLVLIAYNINDVEDLDPEDRPASLERGIRTLERGLTRYSHLVRLVDDRVRRIALKMDVERSGKVDSYRALYRPGSANWLRVRSALQEIRDLARDAGARVYLVHCPWMNVLSADNPYRGIHRQVLQAARELGIPSYDLFDDFAGRDEMELRISPLDGHPVAEGHRIAARAVADDLRRQGLLPMPALD